MREVRWSLTALILLSSACGSTDPVGSSALPAQTTDDSSDDDDKTADTKDAGAGGGKDGGRDAGKDSGTPRKDSGKDTDPNDCGRSAFNTGSVVPDMLIVLDRSGSMKPGVGLPPGASCKDNVLLAIPCAIAGIDCNDPQDAMSVYCGGMGDAVDRWTPSVNAVKSLTAQFDEDVSFGLVTFPSKASNSCGPGDFQVDMARNTSGDIAKVLDNTQPGGNTPTGETLKAALELFESTSVGADTVAPARYVLLVTDGQPTCPSGRGGPQDKQYTIDQIDALAKFGVKTFVVGYDAQLDPSLEQALKEFAQHGGTDDYFPVQNEQSLVKAFDKISKVVATCAFDFKAEITNEQLLRVTLDGVTLKPGDPNGWTRDGQTITIQGDSCAMLQADKEGHRVEMALECEPVTYI